MKKFILLFIFSMAIVSNAFAMIGPSLRDAYAHAYIATATTTTVKDNIGILHTITVNGGTAGTVIVYDNTAASGTIIASFDSTNAIATYTFDCAFTTGLTIITGAATKLSVSYK